MLLLDLSPGHRTDLLLGKKVALVIGGSVGVARVLAVKGCRLAILAHRQPPLEALATKMPVSAEALCQGPYRPHRRTAQLQPVHGRFRHCDILVNNAGINRGRPPSNRAWKQLCRTQSNGNNVNSAPPSVIHSDEIDQRVLPTQESRRARTEQASAGYIGQPKDPTVLAAFLI